MRAAQQRLPASPERGADAASSPGAGGTGENEFCARLTGAYRGGFARCPKLALLLKYNIRLGTVSPSCPHVLFGMLHRAPRLSRQQRCILVVTPLTLFYMFRKAQCIALLMPAFSHATGGEVQPPAPPMATLIVSSGFHSSEFII